jgi:hypothetical protein
VLQVKTKMMQVGKPVPRLEDARFLKGTADYVDDLHMDRMLHAAVFRSACPIVVAAGDRPPAFVRLTLYIGLARLALGIERAEGRVETLSFKDTQKSIPTSSTKMYAYPLREREFSPNGSQSG